MSGIFISYARSTAPAARLAAERLRALGYEVWLDDQLPAHRNYSDVIEERLDGADAVLVLWSAEAVRSQWVRSEANRGREQDKLVQAALEPVDPPLPFDQIQCADLSGWSGEDTAAWRTVVDSMAALLGRGGVRAQPAAQDTPTLAVARRRRFGWPVFAAIGVAALALAGGAAWLVGGVLNPQGPPPARVAVLPFNAAGQGADAQRLAGSIADKLGDALAGGHTDMLPQADAVALSGPEGRARLSRLGVGVVVEGDVRAAGPGLQAHVQVTDLTHHVTLWSKSFEAPAADADLLAQRLASRASSAASLAVDPLIGDMRNQPIILAQFIDIAVGERPPSQQLAAARDLAAKAPKSSLAHALLANMIASTANFTLPPRAQPSAVAEARREAELAIRLDPNNGYAYAVLASQRPLNDWAGREALIMHGLKAQPQSAPLHLNWSHALREAGLSREAAVEAARSLASNHSDAGSRVNLVYSLLQSGQQEDADAAAAEGRRIWPRSLMLLFSEADTAALASPPEPRLLEVLANPARRTAYPPGSLEVVQAAYRAVFSGGPADKAAAAARVRALALKDGMNSTDALGALVNLGDLDGAFLVAEHFTEPANMGRALSMFPFDSESLFSPAMAPMRRDPRFPPLMARMGLLRYWRDSNRWPDFCADPALPYDCRTEATRLAK